MIRCTPFALVCLLSLGCGEVSDSPRPQTKTDPQVAKTTSEASDSNQSQTAPTGEKPPQPETSNENLLAGRPFEVTSAEIKEGILELRQGDDTFAENKLTIFLFLDESGVLPQGESFVVNKDDKSFNHPHVHMRFKGPDDEYSNSEAFSNDYEMTLEFGEEEEKGKLPLTIDLKLPSEKETQVKGEFVAEVSGFRIIDGKVDLTSDSSKTLKHVAKLYLSEQHDGQEVEIVESRDGMYSRPNPENPVPQVGRNIYQYKVGEGESQWTKLIFLKEEAGWQVDDQLELHQLFLAHPLFAPHESSRRGDYAQQVVAKHLEKKFAEMEDKPFVHGMQLIVSYVQSSEFSKVRARYKIGESEEEIQRAFVTEGIDESCEFIREIDYDAKVDPKTGEVKPE